MTAQDEKPGEPDWRRQGDSPGWHRVDPCPPTPEERKKVEEAAEVLVQEIAGLELYDVDPTSRVHILAILTSLLADATRERDEDHAHLLQEWKDTTAEADRLSRELADAANRERDLRAENERLTHANRACPEYDLFCQRCGKGHPYDMSIPSEVWNVLAKDKGAPGGEWSLLCPLCMDELATAKGLTTDVAEFYFVGTSIKSRLYAEDTGTLAHLRSRLKELEGEVERLTKVEAMARSDDGAMGDGWRLLQKNARLRAELAQARDHNRNLETCNEFWEATARRHRGERDALKGRVAAFEAWAAEDAAGESIAALLRVARGLLIEAGDGPVADRLLAAATALDALLALAEKRCSE